MLDRGGGLEIIEVYGVGPQIYQLLTLYWYQFNMA